MQKATANTMLWCLCCCEIVSNGYFYVAICYHILSATATSTASTSCAPPKHILKLGPLLAYHLFLASDWRGACTPDSGRHPAPPAPSAKPCRISYKGPARGAPHQPAPRPLIHDILRLTHNTIRMGRSDPLHPKAKVSRVDIGVHQAGRRARRADEFSQFRWSLFSRMCESPPPRRNTAHDRGQSYAKCE
jgi:hypothetical protein